MPDPKQEDEQTALETLLRHSPLGVLCDLDGTLIPYAATVAEAVPDTATRELVARVEALPGVTFVIVSGRGRDDLDRYFPRTLAVAEHGAFRRNRGGWEPLRAEAVELAALRSSLAEVVERYPRAELEVKTTGFVLHYRRLARNERDAFVIDATAVIESFASHLPLMDCSPGTLALEVRPAYIRKSTAVPWVRDHAGHGARLLAIGDDLADEHMFGALGVGDASIVVRHGRRRPTKARWELQDHRAVLSLLSGIRALRTGAAPHLSDFPRYVQTAGRTERGGADRLLVVSNRLPTLRNSEDGRPANVGGLVSALRPALESRDGLWLGWSGRTVDDAEEPTAAVEGDFTPPLLGVDLKRRWYRDYYNGFCNEVLWPLFHCFPDRVRLSKDRWTAYEEVHRAFADAAAHIVSSRGTVWVHDYHLLLLARELRGRGHSGPIGHFLHVPFPPPDLFEMIPWHAEILNGLLSFDLLGFHTPRFMRNFLATVAALSSARVVGEDVHHRGRRTRTGVFPIGILPDDYRGAPPPEARAELEGLMRILGPAKLVLGVDRLDYTKGIPGRLLAFGRLLELHPEMRTKVSLVQISVPSRADVPHYAEQRAQVEKIVGRINGQYGEAHWVPVQYFYRGYSTSVLAGMYRAAAVGYVTPLRDGMNLVAKEYVAAQRADDPGVLLLSRFAGAAAELGMAVLTNPYDIDGMAEDLRTALTMPLAERRERHRHLLAQVEGSTATTWGEAFLRSLGEAARPTTGL
jgi:trehalose 6-phosphate synthase